MRFNGLVGPVHFTVHGPVQLIDECEDTRPGDTADAVDPSTGKPHLYFAKPHPDGLMWEPSPFAFDIAERRRCLDRSVAKVDIRPVSLSGSKALVS